MEGQFNTVGSAWSRDPIAEGHRQHREREQEMDRQSRCEQWIWRRLAPRTFDSLEALTDAACSELVEHLGRALSEQEHTITIRACVALFAGLVDHAYFVGKISIVRGESIRFLPAA